MRSLFWLFLLSLNLNVNGRTSDSLIVYKILDNIDRNRKVNLELSKSEILIYLNSLNEDEAFLKSKCFDVLGNIYLDKARFDSAEYYFLESIRIRKMNKWFLYEGTSHESIANLYLALNDSEIALEHLKKSLALKMNSGPEYVKSLFNTIGNAFGILGEKDSAHYFYLKSLEAYQLTDDPMGEAAVLNNLGVLKFENDEFYPSIRYFRRSSEILDSLNQIVESAEPIFNTGSVYDWIGVEDSAIFYFNKSLKIYREHGVYENYGIVCYSLAETYTEANQPDSAISMFQNYITYRDSVFEKDKLNAIFAAEEEFRADEERLEKEKYKLENSNKEKVIYMLVAGIIIILLVVFIFIRNSRQKRKFQLGIKNKEIDSLLKEQEAKSYAALLEGQSAERERIAQDLHDRLGGTLSAVHLHFNEINEKVDELKMENQEHFERVSSLLNEAVSDVRRISHDLISGRLSKLGLRGALKDLMRILSSAKQIHVEFEMDNSISNLDQKIEQRIYAIIQELVSNTLKHANASEIQLQLNLNNNTLNIIFEDNGIGFDYSNVDDKGLGLSGIHNRVQQLNGIIDYDSVIGRGTIVIINIPV